MADSRENYQLDLGSERVKCEPMYPIAFCTYQSFSLYIYKDLAVAHYQTTFKSCSS